MTSKKNKWHSFQAAILIVYVVFCCKGSLWQFAEKCLGHDYNLFDCSICNCGWLQSNIFWTSCPFFTLNFTKKQQNMQRYCHKIRSKRRFHRTLAKGVFVCIRSLKHLLPLTLNHNLSFIWRKKWVSDGFLLQLPSEINYHYYYYYWYCCCYYYHCYISTQ